MALSQSNFKAIINRIAEENKLEVDNLFSQIQDLYKPSAPWGSKAAMDLAEKKNVDISKIVPTGKGGRITLDDVKRAAKIKIEKKETLYPFVSKKAKELAIEHGLHKNTEKNFPKKTRTGINKKTGRKTKITLADVRRVAGVSAKQVDFASEAAKKLAEKHSINPADITERSGKGNKIKLCDVEAYITEKASSDEENQSDSEENQSDSEEE